MFTAVAVIAAIIAVCPCKQHKGNPQGKMNSECSYVYSASVTGSNQSKHFLSAVYVLKVELHERTHTSSSLQRTA